MPRAHRSALSKFRLGVAPIRVETGRYERLPVSERICFHCKTCVEDELHVLVLTGDRRQTKQFCFLDADCLVVGESQSSSRRSVGRYPVKPPRPDGKSQTIDTLQCRNS